MKSTSAITNNRQIERVVNLFVLTPERDTHPFLQEVRDSFRVRVIQFAKEVPGPDLLQGRNDQVVLVDASQSHGFSGLSLAKQVRAHNSKIPIVILVKDSSEEFAHSVLHAKINDYICAPFSVEKLHTCINRCLEDHSSEDTQIEYGRHFLNQLTQTIVGNSLAIQELRAYLLKVAMTDSTVLITGETGTGKEMVARVIHESGARQKKPFICINCAAIPENLLESELFGYDPGAFTGAVGVRRGKIELAQMGAILFDEIGDMSPPAQAKILRVIEEQQISRLGGKDNIHIDVRVMAATNQDLDQLIAEGKFRNDLYYRLNVARIHVPSLRDRKEDIPLLLEHYVREFNQIFKRHVEGFTGEALEFLFQYTWPGNIRELKNIVEATFINLPQKTITLMDLPVQFKAKAKEYEHFPQAERDRILSALSATNWNRSKAAQDLRWSRMTLYRKMQKYNLPKFSNGSLENDGSFEKSSVTNRPKMYQSVTASLLH